MAEGVHVIIPTYNRSAALKNTLQAVVPQLGAADLITVLDNRSDSDDTRRIVDQFPTVEFVQNPMNIGGNANILRSFEHARREWLWILGDDDLPKPDALNTIRKALQEDPAAVFHNFSCEIHWRPEKFSTCGLLEFADKIDHVGNAIFISTCLFNRNRLVAHLHEAYDCIHSNAPQMALVISCLTKEKAGKAVFHSRQIAQWNPSPNPESILLNTAELLRAFSSVVARDKFARKLFTTLAGGKAKRWYKTMITEESSVERRLVGYFHFSELAFWHSRFEPRLKRRVQWRLFGMWAEIASALAALKLRFTK